MLWRQTGAALLWIGVGCAAAASAQTGSAPASHARGAFTVAPHAAFSSPLVEALLYNPPQQTYRWRDLDATEPAVKRLEPQLVLSGRGMADGGYRLAYRIERDGKPLHAASVEVVAAGGGFDREQTLDRSLPEATTVSWELTRDGSPAIRGRSDLRWSRFHGRVEYLDGGWRSTSAQLRPFGFLSGTLFQVPIAEDGRFDALVPARVYPVINVNGAGYLRDAMERWAWDYDLTRDREDLFTIGRTELYSIHAFNVVGGPATVFVAFRPSALTRILRFDADRDGRMSAPERKAMESALAEDPAAIAPELKIEDVTVWMDGVRQQVARLDRIPEYDGPFWQVQYFLQFLPQTRPVPAGAWHEIKIEVRSRETLRGQPITDFGQGSVGFWKK